MTRRGFLTRPNSDNAPPALAASTQSNDAPSPAAPSRGASRSARLSGGGKRCICTDRVCTHFPPLTHSPAQASRASSLPRTHMTPAAAAHRMFSEALRASSQTRNHTTTAVATQSRSSSQASRSSSQSMNRTTPAAVATQSRASSKSSRTSSAPRNRVPSDEPTPSYAQPTAASKARDSKSSQSKSGTGRSGVMEVDEHAQTVKKKPESRMNSSASMRPARKSSLPHLQQSQNNPPIPKTGSKPSNARREIAPSSQPANLLSESADLIPPEENETVEATVTSLVATVTSLEATVPSQPITGSSSVIADGGIPMEIETIEEESDTSQSVNHSGGIPEERETIEEESDTSHAVIPSEDIPEETETIEPAAPTESSSSLMPDESSQLGSSDSGMPPPATPIRRRSFSAMSTRSTSYNANPSVATPAILTESSHVNRAPSNSSTPAVATPATPTVPSSWMPDAQNELGSCASRAKKTPQPSRSRPVPTLPPYDAVAAWTNLYGPRRANSAPSRPPPVDYPLQQLIRRSDQHTGRKQRYIAVRPVPANGDDYSLQQSQRFLSLQGGLDWDTSIPAAPSSTPYKIDTISTDIVSTPYKIPTVPSKPPAIELCEPPPMSNEVTLEADGSFKCIDTTEVEEELSGSYTSMYDDGTMIPDESETFEEQPGLSSRPSSPMKRDDAIGPVHSSPTHSTPPSAAMHTPSPTTSIPPASGDAEFSPQSPIQAAQSTTAAQGTAAAVENEAAEETSEEVPYVMVRRPFRISSLTRLHAAKATHAPVVADVAEEPSVTHPPTTVPSEQATVPTEQASVPSEHATVPSEHVTVPSEQATIPTEPTEGPTRPPMPVQRSMSLEMFMSGITESDLIYDGSDSVPHEESSSPSASHQQLLMPAEPTPGDTQLIVWDAPWAPDEQWTGFGQPASPPIQPSSVMQEVVDPDETHDPFETNQMNPIVSGMWQDKVLDPIISDLDEYGKPLEMNQIVSGIWQDNVLDAITSDLDKYGKPLEMNQIVSETWQDNVLDAITSDLDEYGEPLEMKPDRSRLDHSISTTSFVTAHCEDGAIEAIEAIKAIEAIEMKPDKRLLDLSMDLSTAATTKPKTASRSKTVQVKREDRCGSTATSIAEATKVNGRPNRGRRAPSFDSMYSAPAAGRTKQLQQLHQQPVAATPTSSRKRAGGARVKKEVMEEEDGDGEEVVEKRPRQKVKIEVEEAEEGAVEMVEGATVKKGRGRPKVVKIEVQEMEEGTAGEKEKVAPMKKGRGGARVKQEVTSSSGGAPKKTAARTPRVKQELNEEVPSIRRSDRLAKKQPEFAPLDMPTRTPAGKKLAVKKEPKTDDPVKPTRGPSSGRSPAAITAAVQKEGDAQPAAPTRTRSGSRAAAARTPVVKKEVITEDEPAQSTVSSGGATVAGATLAVKKEPVDQSDQSTRTRSGSKASVARTPAVKKEVITEDQSTVSSAGATLAVKKEPVDQSDQSTRRRSGSRTSVARPLVVKKEVIEEDESGPSAIISGGATPAVKKDQSDQSTRRRSGSRASARTPAVSTRDVKKEVITVDDAGQTARRTRPSRTPSAEILKKSILKGTDDQPGPSNRIPSAGRTPVVKKEVIAEDHSAQSTVSSAGAVVAGATPAVKKEVKTESTARPSRPLKRKMDKKAQKIIRVPSPRILSNGAHLTRTIVGAEQKKKVTPKLKTPKDNEEKMDQEPPELSDDDGFVPDLVNPDEEYSEKYYTLLKAELMERMSEETADGCIEVHKITHGKKLTLDNHMQQVVLAGRFEMKPWYDGTYPDEFSRCETLWICDGCFFYYKSMETWQTHAAKCKHIHNPPGDEVYRDATSMAGCISVFKVDGEANETYCKNLCHLAMLFIKDKCVFLDIDQFDFYIVTLFDGTKGGFRPVGYFSRQRISTLANNLSCFCVFPCYQKKGLGRFIIDFSYHLSILSKMPAGPERPFSAFGLVSYTNYWKRTVLRALASDRDMMIDGEIAMDELELETGMRKEDIIEVIEKLFKGTTLTNDLLVINERLVMELAAKEEKKDRTKLYAKRECFEPDFLEYIRNFKSRMEDEEALIALGVDPTEYADADDDAAME